MDLRGTLLLFTAETMVISLILLVRAGRSFRSRHVRRPYEWIIGVALASVGVLTGPIAAALCLLGDNLPGLAGLFFLCSLGNGALAAAYLTVETIHRRSAFRPVVVTATVNYDSNFSREACLAALRERLGSLRIRVLKKHPWPSDLVAYSRNPLFCCSMLLFFDLKSGGGDRCIRVLIDVSDCVLFDTIESKQAMRLAESIRRILKEPPFAGDVTDIRIRRMAESQPLLGPGPEIAKTRKPRVQSFVDRFALYLWNFKTTPTGKFWIAGILATMGLGAASIRVPVYHLFMMLFAICTIAYLLGLMLRPRLAVEGRVPDKATAGQPLAASVTLTNLSRLPAFDLGLGFFHLPRFLSEIPTENAVPALRRGQSATITHEIQPLRRGSYSLPDLRAVSTFPFHFFRSSATRLRGGNLLVLPDFHPFERFDIPMGRRYQPGGIALTSDLGESPEYVGNREYRLGDPVRRIDWRSFARLTRPVVREFMEEYYCRIALVLDTYVPARLRERPEGFPDLEAAVSLTAAAADALSRGEFVIDILAAGSELHVFRAGRNLSHFDNVLEILSCVEPCRANPFDQLLPALSAELDNVTTVVFLFLDWDESREALVRATAQAGCAVKIILIRDGEPTEPLDAGPGAESAIQVTPEAVRKGDVLAL